MAIPDGNEEVRPFVPARDFDKSRAFYRALGFQEDHDKDIAIFRCGKSAFILQRYYQKDWAENFMMQMMVDDLDRWWAHVVALDLPKAFGVDPPKPPAMHPGDCASLMCTIHQASSGTSRSGAHEDWSER